jgi:hypothetical protein
MDRASSETDDKRHRQVRSQFFWFLFFSVLTIGYLVWRQPGFTGHGFFLAAGAIVFSLMTVLSWRSMRLGWTVEQEDRATRRTLSYLFLPPVVLAAVVLAGIALYFAFGWLATIPSSAIIIVLLVLIYLK